GGRGRGEEGGGGGRGGGMVGETARGGPTRERVSNTGRDGGGTAAAAPPPAQSARAPTDRGKGPAGARTNPRRRSRQGISERTARPAVGRPTVRGPARCKKQKRLSATDISAPASMKNVAKCDTWCELQNPVNHRVFERKLRPKPSGRGHVCLGVTQRRPPRQTRSRHGADAGRGGGIWPPVIST